MVVLSPVLFFSNKSGTESVCKMLDSDCLGDVSKILGIRMRIMPRAIAQTTGMRARLMRVQLVGGARGTCYVRCIDIAIAS